MTDSKRRMLTLAFCFYAVSTLISMAVMSIGAGLLLIAMLWAFGGPRPLFREIGKGLRASVDERWYLWISLALAAACVASLAVAIFFPLSYGGKYSEIHIFRDSLKLWYLFWPLLLLVSLRSLSLNERSRILMSWLVAFGILSCVGIVQYFTGWPRPQHIPTGFAVNRYHATLFLGHHLSVASIFIFPFFAALDFGWRSLRERVFGWPRWIWPLLIGVGACTLFFTFSKMLEVALPVGIAIWICMNVPKRMAYALLGVLVLGVGALSQLSEVQARFKHVSFIEGVTVRRDLWEANYEFLLKRPVLGVGWKHNQELSGYYLMQKYPGQEVFSGHAHDDLLDMLGGTGVVGALAWLAWSLLVLVIAWRAWKRPSSASGPVIFASGLFCAWIVFEINGLTQVNFWDAKVTHQMMWVVAWSLLWLRPVESPRTS